MHEPAAGIIGHEDDAAHRDALRSFLRGRHVACPACGYDLCDLSGDRCPECGHAPRLRLETESDVPAWLIAAVRHFGRYGLAYNVGFASLLAAVALPAAIVLVGMLPRPRVNIHEPILLAVLLIILGIGAGLPLLLWWRHRKTLRRMPVFWQWIGVAVCSAIAGLSLTIALMMLLL